MYSGEKIYQAWNRIQTLRRDNKPVFLSADQVAIQAVMSSMRVDLESEEPSPTYGQSSEEILKIYYGSLYEASIDVHDDYKRNIDILGYLAGKTCNISFADEKYGNSISYSHLSDTLVTESGLTRSIEIIKTFGGTVIPLMTVEANPEKVESTPYFSRIPTDNYVYDWRNVRQITLHGDQS